MTEEILREYRANTVKINDCLKWRGDTAINGTPVIGYNGAKKNALLVAYKLTFGEIPKDCTQRKSCGREWCMNPRHLEFLTKEQLHAIENPPGVHRTPNNLWEAKSPPLFGKVYNLGTYRTKERAREAVVAFTPRFEELQRFHARYPERLVKKFLAKCRSAQTYHQRYHQPDQCYFWPGKPDSHGFGKVSWYENGRDGRKIEKATHCLLYELNYGEIPQGKIVLMSCGDKLCVNEKHVRLANKSEAYEKTTAQAGKKSGLPRGVHFHNVEKKYYGKFQSMGKVYNTKYFKTPEEAEAELVAIRRDVYRKQRGVK